MRCECTGSIPGKEWLAVIGSNWRWGGGDEQGGWPLGCWRGKDKEGYTRMMALLNNHQRFGFFFGVFFFIHSSIVVLYFFLALADGWDNEMTRWQDIPEIWGFVKEKKKRKKKRNQKRCFSKIKSRTRTIHSFVCLFVVWDKGKERGQASDRQSKKKKICLPISLTLFASSVLSAEYQVQVQVQDYLWLLLLLSSSSFFFFFFFF